MDPDDPPDRNANVGSTTIDQEAAIRIAYERRTEMASARENIAIAKVGEAAAQNGVKHGLNLLADWGRDHAESGQAYSYTVPVQPPYTVDSATRTSPNWGLALVYSYPIGNRAAKSNYAIAKINSEKAAITLESVMQRRPRRRPHDRPAPSNRATSACSRRRARTSSFRQKKLEAEQKKFDNGMSTSFEVFTFQTDLRNAQLSLIQAMLDYNKALADLERAKGTLLESKGLKLGRRTRGGSVMTESTPGRRRSRARALAPPDRACSSRPPRRSSRSPASRVGTGSCPWCSSWPRSSSSQIRHGDEDRRRRRRQDPDEVRRQDGRGRT